MDPPGGLLNTEPDPTWTFLWSNTVRTVPYVAISLSLRKSTEISEKGLFLKFLLIFDKNSAVTYRVKIRQRIRGSLIQNFVGYGSAPGQLDPTSVVNTVRIRSMIQWVRGSGSRKIQESKKRTRKKQIKICLCAENC